MADEKSTVLPSSSEADHSALPDRVSTGDDKTMPKSEAEDSNNSNHLGGPASRPSGWMYKDFGILGHSIWFAHPGFQLFMVSMVCFLCPGMFNALNGMGGMGLKDSSVAARANTALYSTFAVVAFFAGSFANVLGLRPTLGLGGVGYVIYVASYLCYNHTENNGFVIFSGALLGVCAGLLWTAQGAIMMSYPQERSKGRYISWFWMIFNMGGVIGSLIPLGQNINNKDSNVNDGTYAAFIVLTFLGAMLSFTLCNAKAVVRSDGSRVILKQNPTWKSEFIGLGETLVENPWIVLLFPMFFSSNVFYTYQLNDYNGNFFSTRTRALNSTLYWAAQIVGALMMGHALDFNKFSRSMRAKISLISLFVLTFAVWGGGWAFQKDAPTRAEATDKENPIHLIDWKDENAGYIGPMFLFFFFGWFDAIWQTTVYWYMGALSNSGRKTANMAGFYKGLQSAGAAIWWAIDTAEVKFDAIYGATWGTLAASILIAAPIVFYKIKDHTSVEEDLQNTGETVDDVLAPGMTEKKDIVV